MDVYVLELNSSENGRDSFPTRDWIEEKAFEHSRNCQSHCDISRLRAELPKRNADGPGPGPPVWETFTGRMNFQDMDTHLTP